MDQKQIVKEFSFHGLYLRPDAFKLLISILNTVELSEGQTKLKAIVSKIMTILTDKNQLLDKCYVELDMVKEALKTDQEYKRESTEARDTLATSLTTLDNFSTRQQYFDAAAKIIRYDEKWNQSPEWAESSFHRSKYEFLKYLLEKTDFTYQKHDKNKRRRLMHEIGSMKGQKGEFSIFGIIYCKKGDFYLEDSISDIKLLVDNSKLTLGYVTVGSFVVVHGEMLDHVFKVKEFELPMLTCETEFPKFFPYLQTFYDKSSEDVRVLAEAIDAEVMDISDYVQKQAEACFITVISNFNLNKDNITRLKTILTRFSISAPAALVLCGRFTDYVDISSYEELAGIRDNVDILIKLFDDFKGIVKNMEIFLVPEICDLGLNTFPRGPIFRSLFDKLIQAYDNVHLAQNPCKMRVMDCSITISRMNYITRLVRNSIVPIDSNVEPSEHYIKTILSQRDLIPGLFSDVTVLKKFKNCTMLYDIPDYLVICDDFLPPMDQELKEGSSVVFPSNFSNTGTYVDIYPRRKLCDFKQA